MQYKNWLFGKDGALFRAACQGDLEKVVSLIALGANVNAQSSNGYTPLLRAAEMGHKDVAEYLLKHNADPNVASATNDTPLTVAETNGHTALADYLRSFTSRK